MRQTRVRITNADVSLVLVDPDLAPFIEPEPGDPPMLDWDAVLPGPGRAGAEAWERPADDLDRLAILQFTSGSTADPKGVMLPAPHGGRQPRRHRPRHVARPRRRRARVVAPALPRHGAGGALHPAGHHRHPLVLGAPTDFMSSPSRWMEWISTYGGTATAGPNFSYVLAARALRRSDPLDLSRLRIALNGAEPVDPATVAAFIEAGERARPPTGCGVPGLRHGRGGHRRHLPGADDGSAHRLDRPARAGVRALRRAGRCRRRPVHGRSRSSGGPCSGWRSGWSIRSRATCARTARSASSRSAAPR